MLKSFVFSLAFGALAAAQIGAAAPVQAADAMMKMDCTQAGSMMSDAAKGSPPAMTGDVDKDFMAMIMDREKGTGMILKVEAACGKDPKVKAMAAKEGANADARMAMFRNQSMSQ